MGQCVLLVPCGREQTKKKGWEAEDSGNHRQGDEVSGMISRGAWSVIHLLISLFSNFPQGPSHVQGSRDVMDLSTMDIFLRGTRVRTEPHRDLLTHTVLQPRAWLTCRNRVRDPNNLRSDREFREQCHSGNSCRDGEY